MILKLPRAEGMGNGLDGVGLAVCKVVAWIDAPGGSGSRVSGMQNAVEHRIAQIDVSGRHIDLRTQHPSPVWKLARAHAAEEIKIVLNTALTPGAVASGGGQSATRDANFVRRLIINVGLTRADE